MNRKTRKEIHQWHPAFFACLQVEFADEKDKLIFEEEHLLGTKPTQIDVVIIKKDSTAPIQKNIGQIFRKYNIIEYKSPKDYLCIDDFYKVYAYACFYKSDSSQANEIDINDITITFVCKNFPRKFVKHLCNVKNYQIQKTDYGIYEIKGDILPMQIIVTKDLTQTDNLWLHNLTDELASRDEAEHLIEEYLKHQNENFYESMMNIIVDANQKDFKKGDPMCEALTKLMNDMLDKRESDGHALGIEQGIQVLIESCREFQISKEDSFIKVKNKFNLTNDDTENYFAKYWS